MRPTSSYLAAGILVSGCLIRLAEAQPQPTRWAVDAQAGLVMSTGNGQATSLSAGAEGAWQSDNNKIGIGLGGAYARAGFVVTNDADSDGDIDADEYERVSRTTTRSMNVIARYDRLVSDNNALFVSALAATNEPAAKKFVGGVQVGYGRNLLRSKVHRIVADTGYDLSFETPIAGATFASHSLLGRLRYEGKLSPDSALGASLEALINLNKLNTPGGTTDRFRDRRTTSRLSITTRVHRDLRFRFAFEASHDSRPSLLAATNLPFESGFEPRAQKLDTKTTAVLIVSFL